MHRNLSDALNSHLQSLPLHNHLCTLEAAIDTPKHSFNKLRYVSRIQFEVILRFNASASLWHTLE